jgi:CheY-like chemotaxis protein
MPRNIIAIVDDLFFAAKIRGTAEQAGVSVAFPRSADGAAEIINREPPALIICDLHAQRIDPIDLAKKLKAAAETRSVPLLGFFSHVQVQLKREAEQAGFDRVIPRSVFASSLVQILTGSDD